jgi:hypothetical protein
MASLPSQQRSGRQLLALLQSFGTPMCRQHTGRLLGCCCLPIWEHSSSWALSGDQPRACQQCLAGRCRSVFVDTVRMHVATRKYFMAAAHLGSSCYSCTCIPRVQFVVCSSRLLQALVGLSLQPTDTDYRTQDVQGPLVGAAHCAGPGAACACLMLARDGASVRSFCSFIHDVPSGLFGHSAL